MSKWYDDVFDHMFWAETRLEARVNVINQKEQLTKELVDERKRVGGVLRKLRMARKQMEYWFEPSPREQREMPL